MKVAILGVTGMLGHMVAKVFSSYNNYELVATFKNEIPVGLNADIKLHVFNAEKAHINDIASIIEGCDYAINCIGIIKTSINHNNPIEINRAIHVNSILPYTLAKAAEKQNVKIIQIATDCVYDGKKGLYNENDSHNATDVYGKTKSLGEIRYKNFYNIRCSIIGPEAKGKTSLLEWFLNQPMHSTVQGYVNHYWNGITTLAFAKMCVGIIKKNIKLDNMQHLIPADFISKADLLRVFSNIYNRRDITINDIDTAEPVNRTIITNNSEKNEELWKAAGYSSIPKIAEMIEELNAFNL